MNSFFFFGGHSTHYFDTGYHFAENSHICGKEEKLKNIDGKPEVAAIQ